MTLSQSGDYHADGVAICKPSLLGYVDILGWKAYVHEANQSPDLLDALCGRMDTVTQNALVVSNLDEDTAEHRYSLALHRFSDLLVLAHPLLDHPHEDHRFELELLLSKLVAYQFQLAVNGHACRGSVTNGSVHSSGNYVFGPALIECHEYEASNAVTPRIILTPVMQSFIQAQTQNHSQWSRRILNSLCIDHDGTWFVNYLSSAAESSAEVRGYRLMEHKRFVEDGLARYTSDLKTCEKYDWIANYHNYSVTRLSQSSGNEFDPLAFLIDGNAGSGFREAS